MRSSESWVEVRSAFEQAAGWLVSTAAAAVGRWDAPGLVEWTVRDLIGHTSLALLTVENYLDKGATTIGPGSPVDYFRTALASTGDPVAVAQRGREAGAALGPDASAAVAEIRRSSGCPSQHRAARLLGGHTGRRHAPDRLPTHQDVRADRAHQ
ncbi:MAG: hypothetical protein ABI382_13990 [Nakamurella sp.]